MAVRVTGRSAPGSRSLSGLQQVDLDEAVLEADGLHLDLPRDVLDAALPEVLVEPRVDPDILLLAVHVPGDEASDGLEGVTGAAPAGRLVLARPEGNDEFALELLGAGLAFVACHGSVLRLLVEMAAPPGAALRVAGDGAVGPLHDPGRDPAVAPDRLAESDLPGQALASIRHLWILLGFSVHRRVILI